MDGDGLLNADELSRFLDEANHMHSLHKNLAKKLNTQSAAEVHRSRTSSGDLNLDGTPQPLPHGYLRGLISQFSNTVQSGGDRAAEGVGLRELPQLLNFLFSDGGRVA